MANIKVRKKLGIRVRELRNARRLSQEDFADSIDLHRTYIGAIERGEQNVSIDNLARIAKGLKITLSKLFEGI
jgi:transcriptional regulator with XRE-family HTH domain